MKDPETRTKEEFEECFPFLSKIEFIKKQIEKLNDQSDKSRHRAN